MKMLDFTDESGINDSGAKFLIDCLGNINQLHLQDCRNISSDMIRRLKKRGKQVKCKVKVTVNNPAKF